MSASALTQLAQVQAELRTLAARADPLRQFHPELSPLGWHLGHCLFVERFWIGERMLGEPVDPALAALYLPEFSPKAERGARLPSPEALLAECARLQGEHLALLAEPPPRLRKHSLMHQHYLPLFLLQHHAQHVEIMRMVLAQAAAAEPPGPGGRVAPRPPRRGKVRLAAGEYEIGGRAPLAFDNELPGRRVRLAEAWLAPQPVSNAEYLGFMEDGGYQDRRWWDDHGWIWQRGLGRRAPEHWRPGADGGWEELTPTGPHPLDGEAALLGLSHFEARAFAAWAGARLPHEYEWEAAAGRGLLEQLGESWEWCANRFHPYPGFAPFPYQRYSLPWFDGHHYVLRGASRYSHPAILRVSFRNFYQRDKRQQFAGLRLAWNP